MTFPADYVELLTAAWRDAGSPTMRELSTQTGLPFSTINNYLTGRNRPAPARLKTLAAHLCGDDHNRYNQIVEAYEKDLVEANVDFSGPRWRRAVITGGSRSDSQRDLTEAIRELTEAIRELTAAVKEQTASYDSMVDQLRLLIGR